MTLENSDDINLAIQGITLVGAGFGYADLTPDFSLAPNQKVTFQVWFSPTVTGPSSAKISFLSPNLSSPPTLSLSGDGVSSTPTQHSVRLSWVASPSPVVGYLVYRSQLSGGPFNPLNGAVLDALAYDHSTVKSGTTYYYFVTAVDAGGIESVHSNEAIAVVPPPNCAPLLFRAVCVPSRLPYNGGLPRDLATRLQPLCGSAVQTGHDRMENHETRYPSRLPHRDRPLRLREHLPDSLHN